MGIFDKEGWTNRNIRTLFGRQGHSREGVERAGKGAKNIPKWWNPFSNLNWQIKPSANFNFIFIALLEDLKKKRGFLYNTLSKTILFYNIS